MSYGGTREWALWTQSVSRMASRLYGPGYLYASEEGAARGLARLVATGDVTERGGRYYTSGLDLEVKIARMPRG